MSTGKSLILTAILAASTLPATATTIYTSFGPGEQYNPSTGWGFVSPLSLAYVFQVPKDNNYMFDGARLAISLQDGAVADVDVRLLADEGGTPGETIESFHLENVLGTSGLDLPPIGVSSDLHPTLVAGQKYWLAVSQSTIGNQLVWMTAGAQSSSQQRAIGSGGNWTVTNLPDQIGNAYGAFSIQAEAIPEPTSGVLIFLGMCGILAGWRKTKSRRF